MCQSDEFKCGTGVCVPLSWQCDGEKDCGDGLDEWEELCSKFCLFKTLTFSQTTLQRIEGARTMSSVVLRMDFVFQRLGGVTITRTVRVEQMK